MEVRVGLMADAGDLVGIQEFVKCLKSGEALSTRHVLPDWFMEGVSALGEAAKSGKKVLIFLDEINRGHKDLLQAVFELVLDYSLKGTKLAPGSMVVAASNPPTDDYAVLDFDDSAFQDRFCHIKLEPTLEEFFAFAKGGKMESSMVDFLQEYPQMVETEGKPFNLDFIKPSRRSWDRADKIMKAIEKMGVSHSEVEFELLVGIVGFNATNAYKTFRETYLKSIKAQDVFESYTTSKTVQDSVLKAVEANKTDMLGTLVEELCGLTEKLENGLTVLQADNLAEVIHDLPLELGYGLVLKLCKGSGTHAVSKIQGQANGLHYHPRIVEVLTKITNARSEVKKQAEEHSKKAKKK